MLIISSYSSPGIYQTLYEPWRYFFASMLLALSGPQFSSPLLLYFRGGRVAQWFRRERGRLVRFEYWPQLFLEA